MKSRSNKTISKTGGLYMDKSTREWLISIIALVVILFVAAGQSFATVTCPDCQEWDPNSGTSGECVDDDDQDTTGGDTGEDPDVCGYCQECSDGACVDDDDAGNTDDVCTELECESCQSGECEADCTAEQCCDDDVCVSSCPSSECCDVGFCVSSCTNGCCDDGTCVSSCPSGECCDDGECVSSCPGGGCCDDGTCVTTCPGECHYCLGGTCTDSDFECNWRLCETCNDGECEDKCPALGKYCDYVTGMCEVCVDNFHCELCEQCNALHKCVHPCDTCQWPKYCGWACSCVECSEEAEDTTTCSTSNDPVSECSCSHNPLSWCGGTNETIIYSGNPIKSCTGDDCFTDKVLCYTTYDGCVVSGSYKPLLWCLYSGTAYGCALETSIPGPGCYNCVLDPATALRTNEDTRLCPTEHWP